MLCLEYKKYSYFATLVKYRVIITFQQYISYKYISYKYIYKHDSYNTLNFINTDFIQFFFSSENFFYNICLFLNI